MVSVGWERENVERGEADDPQPETNIRMKKGEKYRIQRREDKTTKRVEILGRAGKATGKYRHAYNIRDLDDGSLGW